MLAVRIDDELLDEVDSIAKIQHTSRSGIVRQAIIRFLEDFEDIRAAEYSLKHMTHTVSLKQLREELELERQAK